MYYFLIGLIFASVLLLLFEAGYVLMKSSGRLHSMLLLYLIACFVNNGGYLLEMTSFNKEAAYVATRILYIGKSYIALTLFVIVLNLCRVKYNKKFLVGMFVMQSIFMLLVLSNNVHHLFYTSIVHSFDGLFPHNIYSHGPIYYVFQVFQVAYCIVALVIAFRAIKRFQTYEEKRQIIVLVGAPMTSMIGFLVFMFGDTKGFDTTNIGIFVGSIAMTVTLFKFNLIDATDMVKTQVVDDFRDGLCVVDSFGEVVYSNKSATTLFPRVEVDKGVLEEIIDASRNNKIFEKCGRFYNVTENKLYQKNVYRGILYQMDDITDERKHAKELEEAMNKANAANEAKSMFLSNMSHEIRTPMNAIVGMTDILLRNDKLDEEQSYYLSNIKDSGNSLLSIINDILDFSKIESGKMELVEATYNPRDMLKNLDILFKTRLGEKSVQLITEIDSKLPYLLYGDELRIRQVILNLMNNAIKYTEKGYVRFRLDVKRMGDSKCQLRFIVQDSGMGIKEEEVPHLFESFTQMDKEKNHQKEGTGLGLSIAKRFVDMMNGEIDVFSQYGVGTTFTIIIPQTIIENEASDMTGDIKKADEDAIDEEIFNGIKVLLAEDNKVNITVAKGLFKPLNMEIDVAINGEIAVAMAKEKKYDLILMDHMMPVMDGIEATKIIRSFSNPEYRSVPIIALTANAVVGAKEEFIDAGMNDMISKPMNYIDACKVMAQYLD